MAVTSERLLSGGSSGIDWLVEGILPVGLSLTGAAPKAGKSWLWLQVARAVATGGEVLGQRVCKTGDVVYLALEDSEGRMASRLAAQNWPVELPHENKVIFYTMDDFTHENGDGGYDIKTPLDNPREIEGILTKRTVLLVIDTFSSAFSKSQASNTSIREPFVALRDMARRRGCCIALVDHKNKTGTIFGSVAKTGFADSIWEITGSVGEGEGVLFITGKDTIVDRVDMAWDEGRMVWGKTVKVEPLEKDQIAVNRYGREVYSVSAKYDGRKKMVKVTTVMTKPDLLRRNRTEVRRGWIGTKELVKLVNKGMVGLVEVQKY